MSSGSNPCHKNAWLSQIAVLRHNSANRMTDILLNEAARSLSFQLLFNKSDA